jgi:hypothetical protein
MGNGEWRMENLELRTPSRARIALPHIVNSQFPQEFYALPLLLAMKETIRPMLLKLPVHSLYPAFRNSNRQTCQRGPILLRRNSHKHLLHHQSNSTCSLYRYQPISNLPLHRDCTSLCYCWQYVWGATITRAMTSANVCFMTTSCAYRRRIIFFTRVDPLSCSARK